MVAILWLLVVAMQTTSTWVIDSPILALEGESFKEWSMASDLIYVLHHKVLINLLKINAMLLCSPAPRQANQFELFVGIRVIVCGRPRRDTYTAVFTFAQEHGSLMVSAASRSASTRSRGFLIKILYPLQIEAIRTALAAARYPLVNL